jgi:hypothetical protein
VISSHDPSIRQISGGGVVDADAAEHEITNPPVVFILSLFPSGIGTAAVPSER